MKKNKRKIVILLLLAFLLSESFFFGASQARATVITANPTETAAIEIGWAEEFGRWVKEDLMKALRDAVVKRIMDSIVDETVQWIQGGGEPKFVDNFGQFIEDSASAAVGDVVLKTQAAFICSPFKAQILLGLLPVPRFGEQVRCSLDTIVSNIDDFYNDFRNGGWVGYSALMQPSGNYYGVALQVSANLNAEAAKAVDAASKEVQAGSGFFAVKRCKGGGYALDAFEDNTPPPGYQKDKDGKYCLAKNMESITPGDTVGESVRMAINSDSQWAANIQSYTSALVNALISRLITEGVVALRPSSSDSSYGGSVGAQLQQDKNQMIAGVNKFVNEWQYILDGKRESLTYSQRIIDDLQELRQIESAGPWPISDCGPMITEPDIQLAQASSTQLQAQISTLETRIANSEDFIDDINGADFNDVNQRSSTQSRYLGFSNTYNTREYLLPITSGSGRQESDNELEYYQNKWRALDQRLAGEIDCNPYDDNF